MFVKARGIALFTGLVVLSGVNAGSATAFEPGEAVMAFSAHDLVSEKLSIKLSKKSGKRGRKMRDRKLFAAFYGQRKFAPLWVSHGHLNQKAQNLVNELAKAGVYGLDADDYKTPALPARLSSGKSANGELSGVDAGRLAQAELELSRAALKYIRHANGGRFDQSKLSRFLDRKAKPVNARAKLAALAKADDAAAFLVSQHPSHPQFKALMAALAKTGKTTRRIGERIRIPRGPVLKYGMKHAQIALVRRRLGVPADKDSNGPRFYDAKLQTAVIAFQKEAGLEAKGVIGLKTRFAMNGPRQNRFRQIMANMERWRWMPRDLGKTHIRVNIPEFMVRVVDNGKLVHEERVVVGKPTNKTPVFSDVMESVVFNPYWNVPQSIIWNEMKGRVPSKGYEGGVRNGRMWVRQTPGPRNALGRVKFLFPNKHAVYMHDTPSKALFNKSRRAFSHGCMRVRNPRKMAEVVLGMSGWSKARISRKWATRTNQHVALKKKIPVHVTYFTLWADKDGSLRSFSDIYGHDNRIYAALSEGVAFAKAKFPEVRKVKIEPRIAQVSRRQRNEFYDNFWTPRSNSSNYWGANNARRQRVIKRKRIYRKKRKQLALDDIFGALF